MEAWRRVWRDGIAPLLSNEQLTALRDALGRDDPLVIQGNTTKPPPLQCVQDWDVEGCCPLSYCGYAGGLHTVGEVEEFFARMCFDIDQRLGEPAGCRWFLNWVDEAPREEMRAGLMGEIEVTLRVRSFENN